MKTVICPGSFDPLTNGHLDVISRASEMFDEVVVLVMSNYRKKDLSIFTIDQRVELIEKCIEKFENVRVDFYTGLLAEYAQKNNINIIVKGLRAVSDFEDEFQQALTNKEINENIETVFIIADKENLFLSSSMVRQIAQLGGDISNFVPPNILSDILKKIRKD